MHTQNTHNKNRIWLNLNEVEVKQEPIIDYLLGITCFCVNTQGNSWNSFEKKKKDEKPRKKNKFVKYQKMVKTENNPETEYIPPMNAYGFFVSFFFLIFW